MFYDGSQPHIMLYFLERFWFHLNSNELWMVLLIDDKAI